MTDTAVREAVFAERQELAPVLTDLPAPQWEAQTLCAGWGVRELVAHMTMPFRQSTPTFVLELLRARGNVNKMADRYARRDAGSLSPNELAALTRDNIGNPWKPPGGGVEGALTHDVIHGLDFTVPLAIDRRVPEDRLRTRWAASAR